MATGIVSTEELKPTLEEIVRELKINNQYQLEIVGEDNKIDELDIDEE